MNESTLHPSPERLHDLVEDSLDAGERAHLDRHLVACERCRSEVDELKSLFAAFSTLPSLSPSPVFADRVMARVRVPRPVMGWVSDWAGALERLTPQTTRGWAAASGVFALPIIALTLVGWWILSQPGVTPQSLWMVVSGVTGDAVTTGSQWLWAQLSASAAAAYVARVLELVGSIGRGEIGLALVGFAIATAGSSYVLYQNLFRNTPRRNEHASYVF